MNKLRVNSHRLGTTVVGTSSFPLKTVVKCNVTVKIGVG